MPHLPVRRHIYIENAPLLASYVIARPGPPVISAGHAEIGKGKAGNGRTYLISKKDVNTLLLLQIPGRQII